MYVKKKKNNEVERVYSTTYLDHLDFILQNLVYLRHYEIKLNKNEPVAGSTRNSTVPALLYPTKLQSLTASSRIFWRTTGSRFNAGAISTTFSNKLPYMLIFFCRKTIFSKLCLSYTYFVVIKN